MVGFFAGVAIGGLMALWFAYMDAYTQTRQRTKAIRQLQLIRNSIADTHSADHAILGPPLKTIDAHIQLAVDYLEGKR